jgi:hypothetical protein
MRKALVFILVVLALACRETRPETPGAQAIVDRAIEAAGGDRYEQSRVRFTFRDRQYEYYREAGTRVLKRTTATDTARIEDILTGGAFERKIDGQPVALADSTRKAVSEAVNSVHYFAYLPYGLNDAAVKKEYLGKARLKGSDYHKVRVTFREEGGGTDFEDVFVYWFHTESFLPDYLAYEYHTNGGGKRFREAYNERRAGGIRFADYKNYKYSGSLPVSALDSLFEKGELELLSRIELTDLEVIPGNYN